MALAFHSEHWRDENDPEKLQLGIGGGYDQFGILSEEEFLRLLKTPGRRT